MWFAYVSKCSVVEFICGQGYSIYLGCRFNTLVCLLGLRVVHYRNVQPGLCVVQ